MTITYQQNSGGYWVSRYSITSGFIQQPWSGDGEEHIQYYDIRNGIGSVLASDTQNVLLMSGHGSGLTTEQHCAAIAKGMEDLAEEIQSWVDMACFLPPVSFEHEGVAMEPFDLCGTQAQAAAKTNRYRTAAVNAACNVAPGCYIAGEGDCFSLINKNADLGPYFAEWAEAEDLSFISSGPCPNTRSWKRKAGTQCVETIEEKCEKLGSVCVCEKTNVAVACIEDPLPLP